VLFTVPETYGPVLLVKRAQRIRKETGDSRYYAPMEANKTTIGRRLYNILAMPFKILFLEPMLITITVYQSVGSYPFPRLYLLTRCSSFMAAFTSCLKRTQLFSLKDTT
jgi:hypothetical protein